MSNRSHLWSILNFNFQITSNRHDLELLGEKPNLHFVCFRPKWTKNTRTLLTGRSNYKARLCLAEFSPLYSTTFDKKISPTSGLYFLLMAGTTRLELFVNRFMKHLLTQNAYKICNLIEKLSLIM